MNEQPAIYAVKPVLIKRAGGGWLAITPRGWPLSIGVIAETNEAARRQFDNALRRWSAIKERRDGD